MRDIARIPRIMLLLCTIWKRYPDMRFGQLMYNIMVQMPEVHKFKNGAIDPFHLEDYEFENYLNSTKTI